MTSPEENLLVLKPGDKAPEFEAPMFPNGQFRLSEFYGKNLILAFYPRDNTPGCTAEMCAFSNELSRFETVDTVVIGVSCDSMESHERFTSNHNLKIPLISDAEGKVGRMYGALREGRNSAYRKLFIIDKNAVIKKVIDGMPDNEQILHLLGSL